MSTITRDPTASGAPDAASDPGLPARVRTVHTFARPLTPDEFMTLPDPPEGGKLELVDGQVVQMPPVAGDHTDIADVLLTALKGYVAERGGEAYGRAHQELTYRLPLPPAPDGSGRSDQVREPDVSLVTADALRALPPAHGGPVLPGHRLPRTYVACVPAVAAEVLSDHDYDRWKDFLAKVEDYLSAGVALVWVLSPRHDTVTVYDQAGGLASPALLKRSAGDHLEGGTVLPGFSVPLTALFRPAS